MSNDFLEKNPWSALRQFTNARIALGRAGNSLPTEPLLAFNLSHAQARDAVHQPLDADSLHEQLRANGFTTLDVHSAAPDRQHYLRRPDLGRRLADDSREALALEQAGHRAAGCGVRDRRRLIGVRGIEAIHSANCRRCARNSRIGKSDRSWSRGKHAWRWATRSASCWARNWW